MTGGSKSHYAASRYASDVVSLLKKAQILCGSALSFVVIDDSNEGMNL
jgi:hypothetical protein